MLGDYINAYKQALAKGDEKTQRKIERELRSLGMDKATLMLLAREVK